MRDFLFQIVLFIAGAVIGVTVPLLSKRGQKWAVGTFAGLLIGTSLFWIGYELGARQQHTLTSTNVAPSTAVSATNKTSSPAASITNLANTATTEDLSNWAVEFEGGSVCCSGLDIGANQYEYDIICPNNVIKAVQIFRVSQIAKRYGNEGVYFRLDGIYTTRIGGIKLDTINFSQQWNKYFTITNLTETEVARILNECEARFSISNGEFSALIQPTKIFQILN